MNQSARVISGAFLLNLNPFEVKSVFGCLLVNIKLCGGNSKLMQKVKIEKNSKKVVVMLLNFLKKRVYFFNFLKV